MISDILQKHDQIAFQKVLGLIYNAQKSTTESSKYKMDEFGNFLKDSVGDPQKEVAHYEITIPAYLYFNHLNYCESSEHDAKIWYQFFDVLDSIFDTLVQVGAIHRFYRLKQNNQDYTPSDYIVDNYQNENDGTIEKNAPHIRLVELYFDKGGTVFIDMDIEKFRLFYDIIYKQKSYICKLGTIKALLSLKTSLDSESFLDWIKIDKKYIFDDYEVLLYSIASSSRLNLAKMYYYFSKHVFETDWRITAIEYDTFVREWKTEESDLLEQVKDHSTADKDFLLTSNHILDLANRAYALFVSSNAHQKRQILNLLFTNFSATREKLIYKIKEPLGAVLFAGENQKWLPG